MILVVGLRQSWLLDELLARKVAVLLSDGLMLLSARRLSRNHGLGAFTPLPIHEIRLLKLVLEEPVLIRRALGLTCLASDDEAFGVASIVVSSLGDLV